MAPKITCNPLKLDSVTTYFQKSRVAHNIKDLEKHLPSVASINWMQVKGASVSDYLQSLSDENRICVEKIGSGNWYWSFASQDLKTRQKALEEANSAHAKALAVVDDIRAKLSEMQAQRADDEDMLDAGGESREDLTTTKAILISETKTLQQQLAAYSDDDPTELDRKCKEITKSMAETEQYTDEIYSMEGWFKDKGQDRENMAALRADVYGDELDREEGVLRDLD